MATGLAAEPVQVNAADQDAIRHATGVRLIWVETPPSDDAWAGIRDRLQRAAAA